MLRTIFIVLALTNFGWQAFHGRDWQTAIERTIFQGDALLSVGIARWLNRRRESKKPEEWTPPAGPVRQPKRGDPDYIASIDG